MLDDNTLKFFMKFEFLNADELTFYQVNELKLLNRKKISHLSTNLDLYLNKRKTINLFRISWTKPLRSQEFLMVISFHVQRKRKILLMNS